MMNLRHVWCRSSSVFDSTRNMMIRQDVCSTRIQMNGQVSCVMKFNKETADFTWFIKFQLSNGLVSEWDSTSCGRIFFLFQRLKQKEKKQNKGNTPLSVSSSLFILIDFGRLNSFSLTAPLVPLPYENVLQLFSSLSVTFSSVTKANSNLDLVSVQRRWQTHLKLWTASTLSAA